MQKTKGLFITVFLLLSAGLSAQTNADGVAIDTSETPILKTPSPIKSLVWSKSNGKFAYTENNNIFVRESKYYSILHVISYPNPFDISFTYENFLDNDILSAVSDSAAFASWALYKNPDLITMPPSIEAKFASDSTMKLTAATLSEDSTYIAFALSDNTIRWYMRLRFSQNTMERSFEGHTQPVYGMRFSENNAYLATSSPDNSVLIWDTINWKNAAKVKFYGQSDVTADFTKDSQELVALTARNVLSFMDFLQDGKILRSITLEQNITDFHLLNDGKRIAILLANGLMELYDIKTCRKLGYIPPCNPTVMTTFAFDSKDEYILEGYSDGSVYKLKMNKITLLPDQEVPRLMETSAAEIVKENPETSAQKEDILEEEREKKKNKEKEQTKVDASDITTEYERHRLKVEAGYSNAPSSSFMGGINLGAQYEFCQFYPYYFGGGLFLELYFPDKNNFAYYVNGEKANPPVILGARPYGLAGINVATKNPNIKFFTELLGGMAVRSVWNGSFTALVATKFYYTGFGGIAAGVSLWNAIIRVEAVYDSGFGVILRADAGYSIRLGQKMLVSK